MKTLTRGLAVVENAVDIARSPEDVFEYFVRFERSVAWESVGRSGRLDAKAEGRVSVTEDGAHLVMRMELRPSALRRETNGHVVA